MTASQIYLYFKISILKSILLVDLFQKLKNNYNTEVIDSFKNIKK